MLQEKLKCAADLDAAVAIAKEAGFNMRKADWLSYQAKQTIKLSDEELDVVSGGKKCVGPGGQVLRMKMLLRRLRRRLIAYQDQPFLPSDSNLTSPCNNRCFLILK